MGLDVGAEFMESLQGRPLTRLSAGAGLLEGVAPALLCGGEVPCSEGFTRLSSDDIGIDAILFFFAFFPFQLNSAGNPRTNFSQSSHMDQVFGEMFRDETFLVRVRQGEKKTPKNKNQNSKVVAFTPSWWPCLRGTEAPPVIASDK